MRRMHLFSLAILAALLINGAATRSDSTSNRLLAQMPALPEFDKLKSQPDLPDPLVMLDGRKVADADQWNKLRRPELKELFQHYMYGYLPKKPQRTELEHSWADGNFLDGKATISEETIGFFGPDLPQKLRILTIRPNVRGPVPVFVAMNFCGNHTVAAHPKIALPTGWIYNSCPGVEKERATEKGRGGQADVWNADLIVERGYALVTFYSGDIDPDTPDFSDGIEPHFYAAGQKEPKTDDAGAIAAWAWGYHRVVDHLLSRHSSQFDAKRIAAVGHSRNGKTTLLAAAMDERIALAIPHQAGCGGTAPSRGKIGESVKQINDRFPHWFCDEFTKFNSQTDRLPFDQHCLVALCAPRPVLFTNAIDDQWANPDGQFDMLKAAEPVYKLLNAGGLDATARPELNKLVDSQLGYFIRPGKHSMNRQDWEAFLQFADKRLGK
ncbi:MAG TPA: acetylxylan esterase [Pirellulaceae bacterium]|nr:acetylxylan esterase [Pirellulaceae bacterium]